MATTPAGENLCSLPKTSAGRRHAWSLVEDTWARTVERAGRLGDDLAHRRVDDEWSLVETLRDPIFVTDAWGRRTLLGETAPSQAVEGVPGAMSQPPRAILCRTEEAASPAFAALPNIAEARRSG
jgi:hypothetical protein